MNIITISREFGSGGRELGKRLAGLLGFAYYDREILTTLAHNAALDETYVETALETGWLARIPLTFGASFTYLPSTPHDPAHLLREEHKLLRTLAQRGDCVIIGRNADLILQSMEPFKIFVYADLEAKLARCRAHAAKEEPVDDATLKRKIRQLDKQRANHHALLSAHAWGDKAGYHLCVNTTGRPIKTLSDQVAHYARAWFAARG